MAFKKRIPLSGFIHECMTDTEKEGRLRCFTLMHRVGSTQVDEVHSTNLGSKEFRAEDLAAMFNGKAERYSQDLHGVQTFNLLAFWGENKEPQARQTFVVNMTGNDGSGLTTEGPSEEGRTLQKMRQQEMTFQQMYVKQEHLDNFAIKMMHMMFEENQKLRKENMDAFDIVKEFMMKDVLSQQDFEMKKLAFERGTIERRKWLQMAPPLVNTLLGREVFPIGTEDTALIESIAESLSEEDIMKLSGVLKPELIAPLMSRWQKHMEQKVKTQQELARALPAHPNPERDAAGDPH